MDVNANNHRKKLDDFLKRVLDSQKSLVVTAEKYEDVIRHLRAPNEKVDPHFKAWVKKRQFQLMSFPGLGIEQSLVVPNKKQSI